MAENKTIAIINGPNLSLLGEREPELYGTETLAQLEQLWQRHAASQGWRVTCCQHNGEGEIITALHQSRALPHRGVIINAGAYAHTSHAIADALRLLPIPAVEIHISNIYNREPFRSKSVLVSAVDGMICGLGNHGYILAIDFLIAKSKN